MRGRAIRCSARAAAVAGCVGILAMRSAAHVSVQRVEARLEFHEPQAGGAANRKESSNSGGVTEGPHVTSMGYEIEDASLLPGRVAPTLLQQMEKHSNKMNVESEEFDRTSAKQFLSGINLRTLLSGVDCDKKDPSYLCSLPSTGKEYCCPYQSDCEPAPEFDSAAACFQVP